MQTHVHRGHDIVIKINHHLNKKSSLIINELMAHGTSIHSLKYHTVFGSIIETYCTDNNDMSNLTHATCANNADTRHIYILAYFNMHQDDSK